MNCSYACYRISVTVLIEMEHKACDRDANKSIRKVKFCISTCVHTRVLLA